MTKITWEEALKFYNEHRGTLDGSLEHLEKNYREAKTVFIEGDRMYMRDITAEFELPNISVVYGVSIPVESKKPWWKFW